MLHESWDGLLAEARVGRHGIGARVHEKDGDEARFRGAGRSE